MRDIATIILKENEGTGFDSKLLPYRTEEHEEFLRDVMAMANADYEGDRFIIIGLKVHPDGRRDLLGVPPEQLKDAADYQSLVRQNIEPDVQLSYSPFILDSKHYGVFRIYGCTDQPYLMKKQFGKLAKGDGWIRTGTSKDRLVRRDYDRMYSQKAELEGFKDDIEVTFEAPGNPTELEIASVGEVVLPSWVAAAEIRSILTKRRKSGETGEDSLARTVGSVTGHYSYSALTNKELEDNLKELEEGPSDRDKYLLETLSHKINLSLYNSGTTHVQDALIKVQIPDITGLSVAEDVYSEPVYGPTGMRLNFHMPTRGYPDVTKREGEYISESALGDLRHRVATPAFAVPLRIVVSKDAEGQRIALTCTLYGRNLRGPRVHTLTLIIVPKQSAGKRSGVIMP